MFENNQEVLFYPQDPLEAEPPVKGPMPGEAISVDKVWLHSSGGVMNA